MRRKNSFTKFIGVDKFIPYDDENNCEDEHYTITFYQKNFKRGVSVSVFDQLSTIDLDILIDRIKLYHTIKNLKNK